jgi:hypothetical protein
MKLVPLSLATRHVYLSVPDFAANSRPRERLNGLGRLMASLGGLYVMDGPDAAPRRLSEEELAAGFLGKGSADVHVTRRCIAEAITALRKT